MNTSNHVNLYSDKDLVMKMVFVFVIKVNIYKYWSD